MVKDEYVMGDVEEGEISDVASVQEISEEDFNKQEGKNSKETEQMTVVGGGGNDGGNGGNTPRVWTMRDLLKYPACRGWAASGLYNLAWAHAVQNKPLNEVLVMDVEPKLNSKPSSESSDNNNNSKEDNEMLIEDSVHEKEEGELEEGEIDLESDPADNLAGETQTEAEGALRGDIVNGYSFEIDEKEKDLENRVKSIRGVLESTSVVEAHTSFEGVCSKLLGAFESLRELVSENFNVPKMDILVQLSFAALQTINSVFCSMNKISKEQNKETVSRLLSFVKGHFSPFLSPNQIKEIEVMIQSVKSSDVALSAGTSDKEKEGQVADGISWNYYDALAVNKLSTAVESSVNNKQNMPSVASNRGASNIKSRAPLLPLLDLHKDHDIDSLPSPTRETTPSLPVNRSSSAGRGSVKPDFFISKAGQSREDAKVHPYENDALRAVSTYQQKFGCNSFFPTESLPSPTPSEESNDGIWEIGGEVSSSSVVSNSKPVQLPTFGQPIVSPTNVNHTSLHASSTAINAVPPPNNMFNLTVKSSAKSRDPRLRFASSDTSALDVNQHSLNTIHNTLKVESSGASMSSRKKKSIDEAYTDNPVLKRHKHGSEDCGDVQTSCGSGGWLEDIDASESPSQLIQNAVSDPRKMQNGVTSTAASVTPTASVTMGEPAPVTASTSTVAIPSLLEDIAVNPTILLNLLKMGEKQRVTESSQQKPTDPRKRAQLPGSNSTLGAVTPAIVSPSNPSDESGKIRMKPRDPRRVLHGNTLQRTGSLVEEQFKVNDNPTSGRDSIRDKIDGQAETNLLHSQLVQPQDIKTQITNNLKNVRDLVGRKQPDIAPQFTKNLKNIADLIAVSQAGNPPTLPQNQPPQSTQLKTGKDVKCSASKSGDPQSGSGSTPGTDTPGPVRASDSWVDVEHLFEGYDDKQKAAIQRERARRMEEQGKMFAASKLCLVLDLDHTLLNSAKFNEVDPVHDEILRRKEEQDREKPQRHLFRFPHMAMWTKLRPGIWNFLDKASKLYELHLYTMGNKLYATEMAKVLDPKGSLFNGRVISRGDDGDPFDGDERVPKSKDLEGVLGMESAVVIIDDSVRVWPHNKMNLIVVERYTYFPCSRRQFGLLGPSLLEIDHDERPEAGTLASSLAVIERIHQNFFSHPSLDEADVRNILASEQRKILAGCRIVFSRVFPVGEANPNHHPLWQTAEQFGAVCTTQIDEHVTHVVANSLGTDKVNWALSAGRFVVHPGWVEASALLYRRANENDFAIKQ